MTLSPESVAALTGQGCTVVAVNKALAHLLGPLSSTVQSCIELRSKDNIVVWDLKQSLVPGKYRVVIPISRGEPGDAKCHVGIVKQGVLRSTSTNTGSDDWLNRGKTRDQDKTENNIDDDSSSSSGSRSSNSSSSSDGGDDDSSHKSARGDRKRAPNFKYSAHQLRKMIPAISFSSSQDWQSFTKITMQPPEHDYMVIHGVAGEQLVLVSGGCYCDVRPIALEYAGELDSVVEKNLEAQSCKMDLAKERNAYSSPASKTMTQPDSTSPATALVFSSTKKVINAPSASAKTPTTSRGYSSPLRRRATDLVDTVESSGGACTIQNPAPSDSSTSVSAPTNAPFSPAISPARAMSPLRSSSLSGADRTNPNTQTSSTVAPTSTTFVEAVANTSILSPDTLEKDGISTERAQTPSVRESSNSICRSKSNSSNSSNNNNHNNSSSNNNNHQNSSNNSQNSHNNSESSNCTKIARGSSVPVRDMINSNYKPTPSASTATAPSSVSGGTKTGTSNALPRTSSPQRSRRIMERSSIFEGQHHQHQHQQPPSQSPRASQQQSPLPSTSLPVQAFEDQNKPKKIGNIRTRSDLQKDAVPVVSENAKQSLVVDPTTEAHKAGVPSVQSQPSPSPRSLAPSSPPETVAYSTPVQGPSTPPPPQSPKEGSSSRVAASPLRSRMIVDRASSMAEQQSGTFQTSPSSQQNILFSPADRSGGQHQGKSESLSSSTPKSPASTNALSYNCAGEEAPASTTESSSLHSAIPKSPSSASAYMSFSQSPDEVVSTPPKTFAPPLHRPAIDRATSLSALRCQICRKSTPFQSLL